MNHRFRTRTLAALAALLLAAPFAPNPARNTPDDGPRR